MKRLLGLLLVMGMVGCGQNENAGNAVDPSIGADEQLVTDSGGEKETPTSTSWVSDPNDRNNVKIEAKIRRAIKKPTGELTKADLEKVTKLDLRVNPELTDAGLAHLKGLSRLKTLILFYCPTITGSGLQHLATLEQLEELNLTFCRNIPREEISSLKQALPKCRILHGAKFFK